MSHSILIQPGDHRFVAEPGENLLEAALRQGVHLPYGCRNGFCGHCRAVLVSGQVGYPEPPPALEGEDRDTVLMCQAQAESDLVINARIIETETQIEPVRLPVKVVGRRQLAADVIQVSLKLPEARRVPFLAGQYLDILTPDGQRRSFSIANPPHEDEVIELHVRHVEGGEYTSFIFDRLKVGDILRIEMPLGGFWLHEDSQRPMVLMGGGTGFAPLKAIIEHARHIGHRAPMHLFWGARNREGLYLDELPRRWQREIGDFDYTPVLSHPDPADDWPGETGFVHEAVLRRIPDLARHDVYMSGPPAMIEAARQAFLETGLPQARMFSDAFEFNRLLENAG